MSQNLTDAFEAALSREAAGELDRIETRRCTSDAFDGVQYNFYGHYIPVRPLIDVVAEADGYAIEQMQFANDRDEPCLGMFIADIAEQSHPAFVN